MLLARIMFWPLSLVDPGGWGTLTHIILDMSTSLSGVQPMTELPAAQVPLPFRHSGSAMTLLLICIASYHKISHVLRCKNASPGLPPIQYIYRYVCLLGKHYKEANQSATNNDTNNKKMRLIRPNRQIVVVSIITCLFFGTLLI